MISLSGIGRFLASSAVGLVVLTAACSDVVAKDNVAKTIMDQLQKQNIDAQNVMCPTDLQAMVGQTVRCSFTVDGQPVDAIATVTSVDGSNVKYDITTEARPIAKDLLAHKITDQVSQQARLPVDAATCDADLQPRVNATTTCTLISRNQPMNVTVTVTKVSGGLIKYAVKRA
jgi:Domain of unknown function (DUF4333)